MVDVLNYDVLDQILQACTTSSLATLSLVSSHVRALALPHLLHTVSLGQNREQILSFLDFILDNTQSRNVNGPDLGLGTVITGAGTYIVKLEILHKAFYTTSVADTSKFRCEDPECENPEEKKRDRQITTQLAPALTRALNLMPNLRSIFMQGYVEEFATHSPDFALAVLSRSRLTSINLCGVGPNASKLFGQAIDLHKNDIKLETIKLKSVQRLPVYLGTSEGIGGIIFHSKAHLTELCLWGCNLENLLGGGGSNVSSRDIKTPVIFPKVHTLSLEACIFSLEALAIAFPTVCTIVLGHTLFSPDAPIQVHDRSSTPSFPSLTSIEGNYSALHDFISSCAHDYIRRIVFSSVPCNKYISTSDLLPAVSGLKSLQFFLIGSIKPFSWWTALSLAMPNLTYLNISVGESWNRNDPDMLYIHVPRILASLPLAYISLNAGKTFASELASDDQTPEVSDEAIVLSYARNIPTLEYMDTSLQIDYQTYVHNWWSVLREDSGSEKEEVVCVKAMEAGEGCALRHWYDLEAWIGRD